MSPKYDPAVHVAALKQAGDDAALAQLAADRPGLADALFAAASFAVDEIDQFTESVKARKEPFGWSQYTRACVQVIREDVLDKARGEAVK